MRVYIFIWLTLICYQGVAQVDSLKWPMANDVANGSYAANFKSSVEVAAKKEVKETGPIGEIEKKDTSFYLNEANQFVQTYIENGELKSDLNLLNTAIQTLESRLPGSEDLAKLHYYVGQKYGNHGWSEKQKEQYRLALSIWNSLPEINYIEKFKCHNELMVSESVVHNFEPALLHARAARDLIPHIKDYSLLIRHYSSYGSVLAGLRLEKDFEASRIQAWEIAQEHGNDYEKVYTSHSLAHIYIGDKKFDLILDLIDEPIKYYTKHGDINGLLDARSIKAKVLKDKGDVDSWISIMNDILTICRDSVYYSSCRQVFYTMANEGRDVFPYAYQDALFEEQIAFSEKLKDHAILTNTYFTRALYAKDNGDFEKSNENLFKHLEIEEKTRSIKLQESVAEEKTKQNIENYIYKTQKAELQSQLLQQRNQLFIFISITLLSLFLIGVYFYRKLSATKKEIAAQKMELEQLNDTKDKFFSIIAHDIRSPISALNGIGEQMAFYLKKGDERKLNRLTERVDSTSNRLSRLLDNLLNWALLQKGTIPYHPEKMAISTIVEENMALFAPLAISKEVQIENFVDDAAMVFADNTAVSTIVRNLLNNAVKFTSKGDKISFSNRVEEDKIWLTIKDTGMGMPEEKLNALFGLEIKSKKGTAGEKGTGLGLVLVKELLELNKGGIVVNSQEGQGSEFSFHLPKQASNQ